MPIKAIYWQNPQKHRAACRKRKAYLAIIGVPHKYQILSAALARKRVINAYYCRTHRAVNIKAQRKYRRKLQRLFGSCNRQAAWRHHNLKEQQNARKRKAAIASLSRRLVESRERMHLVSRKYSAERSVLASRQVVLHGRNSRLQRPIRFALGSRIRTGILL